MSPREHHDFEVRQAPDRLARRRIALVTAAAAVTVVVALLVAWGLLEAWGQEPRRAAPPVAPRTIGTLEQTLILHTERGIELRREQEAELRRWGWIDRDAGVARIPIETAMELMAAHPLPPDRALSPEHAHGHAPGGHREEVAP